MKLKKLFNLTTLFLLIVLFAFPLLAMAQEEPTPLPEWASFLPAILTSLVGFNFKATDIFRRMLASNNFGGTPPKDVQNVLVIVFSLLLGIGLVLVTPNAASFVPDILTTNFWAKVLFTGVSISTLGGFIHDLSKRVNGGNPVFKQTTEVNAPPAETSQKTASETLAVASQAVDGKG
jgi:hypothetical protein